MPRPSPCQRLMQVEAHLVQVHAPLAHRPPLLPWVPLVEWLGRGLWAAQAVAVAVALTWTRAR